MCVQARILHRLLKEEEIHLETVFITLTRGIRVMLRCSPRGDEAEWFAGDFVAGPQSDVQDQA